MTEGKKETLKVKQKNYFYLIDTYQWSLIITKFNVMA